MRAILASRDSVLVLPTGGGKSVCFQAPAVVQAHGVGVVISPLISLMKDQVDGLRVDGVAASYLNSTQTAEERDAVVASLRADRCRLLYVSPERIVGDGGPALRRLLQQSGVRFIAVDEAHCISQWGHDFRPEYRQLGRLRDDFPGVSLHAFTATATERVRADIAHELRLNEPAVLVGSFDRPNLTYRVLRRGNLHSQLRAILDRHEGDAGIVYCLSRREVESLATWLRRGRPSRRAVPCRPSRSPYEAATRKPFSRSAPTSWSPRWRSAWASIDRTCALWCTPAHRGPPSTISRNRAARAATGCRPSACSSTPAPISSAGGRCSRRTAS